VLLDLKDADLVAFFIDIHWFKFSTTLYHLENTTCIKQKHGIKSHMVIELP